MYVCSFNVFAVSAYLISVFGSVGFMMSDNGPMRDGIVFINISHITSRFFVV